MENCLISVIVPIYNVEDYLSKCIESIVHQTYHNIQIILVDDGSTDRSGLICDKYAELDQRIQVIHQKNRGLVVARKTGLQAARGEYIGFVDGDDYIAPEMYEKLLNEIVKYDADFVHSSFWRGLIKEVLFTGRVIEFSEEEAKEKFLFESLLGETEHISPSIWSKLFKNDFIKGCYQDVLDNVSIGEDLLNFCICILRCRKIVLLEDAYYYYRVRDDSMSNQIELSDLVCVLRLYDNMYKIMLDFGLKEEFKLFVENYGRYLIIGKFIQYFDNDFQLERYYYGYSDDLLGKRIVIYGAGSVGRDYYAQISRFSNCEIVAWVDAYPEKYAYSYIDLYDVEILDRVDFDILVVAVKQEKMAKEICNQLICKGIERHKIFWSKPKMYENVMLKLNQKE